MKALLIFVIIEYLVLDVLYTIDLISYYKEFRAIVMKYSEKTGNCDSLGEGGK